MGGMLAKLLGNDHPRFAVTLEEFERASGNSGIDARLVADTTETAHRVMRGIGLDPVDTSAKELYLALNALIERGVTTPLEATPFTLLEIDDHLISFNLIDVIENSHHHLSIEDRRVDHAQRRLRAEIIRRYAEHERTSTEMIEQQAKEIGLDMENDQNYEHADTVLQTAHEAANEPSVLMIGDIFTDAFIKLNESSAKIIEEGDTKWLALPFGQKPPYDTVDIVRSVGPSPNAAVSASRLGVRSSLMAWVGSDDVGKEAIGHLQEENVGVDSMVTEEGKATSYWYVLRYGADRTMLVKSEKYEYCWQDPVVEPDWIYLSYIGEDSWPLHEALLDYLRRHPKVKLAFQPGTFHFKWGVDKLREIYGRSHIVVMNREEAVDVSGRAYDDLRELTIGLHELGPQIVVITDGPNGSYASYDFKLVTIPNYPDPADPLDRTGAGDAFASTIVSALALGKSMDEALTWAPINSMNVVQHLGAQAGLLKRDQIESYLNDSPEDYKLTVL
jgi:sugar/nucleoside kinase (ribokinase family)